MPELPEVETVCRGLAKVLTGTTIVKVDIRRPDLRTALPNNLATRLKGRHVLSIQRRAKYILINLDKHETLTLHLGMSGRMVITHKMAKPKKHDHLIFSFENSGHSFSGRRQPDRERANPIYIHFNDPRRFGLCDLILTKDLPTHKLMRHLGVEPLEPQFTAPILAAKFKGKKTSVKAALLNQKLVVGIGNIYAAEALFHAGISPKRRAGACTKLQVAKLVPAIRKVLLAAIKAGGSSLRDYVQANGELGYFQHHFAVYDRENKPCPGCTCDINKTRGIRRITQDGRSSFYCPRKQV